MKTQRLPMLRAAARLVFACLCFWLQIVDAPARTKWVTFDCRYDVNPSNDGDSFHVRCAKNDFIFRLYFVDAPETEPKLAERLDEQLTFFNVTSEQAIKVGEAARRFTREKLSRGFKVYTCMEPALGDRRGERYYAFIQTSEGDLGELLVKNGLARVYGSEMMPPNVRDAERERERLERLQREAKLSKLGAWGIAEGGLNRRAPSGKAKEDAEWVERFFHPDNFARDDPERETLAVAAAPAPRVEEPLGRKLDINTASESELKNLPGVGPAIAKSIIAAREFKSADELRKVPGIGRKRYEKLRPYFQ